MDDRLQFISTAANSSGCSCCIHLAPVNVLKISREVLDNCVLTENCSDLCLLPDLLFWPMHFCSYHSFPEMLFLNNGLRKKSQQKCWLSQPFPF